VTFDIGDAVTASHDDGSRGISAEYNTLVSAYFCELWAFRSHRCKTIIDHSPSYYRFYGSKK